MQPNAFLDDDGKHVWWYHDCLGMRVETRLPINSSRGWSVASKNPLTVSPSIQCHTCGIHGWVRKGEWVDA